MLVRENQKKTASTSPMKPFSGRTMVKAFCGALAATSCLAPLLAAPADFTVTSPGFFYSINSASPNPVLTVVRGNTYTFAVSTESDHPFEIRSTGVSNNNISSGTITWTVPLAASNYTYICSIHGFGNQIMTVAPPSPPAPTVRILSLSVSTNITLRSTGTNNWSVLPEFKTNLALTNWFALTVQTNKFLNGTNETICGRPPGDQIFIRIKSQPN
jgi:hypothetical protein